jgi:deoxycytidylate deaminase
MSRLATGANECPRANGGAYWAVPGKLPQETELKDDARDYKLGYDSNKIELQKIMNEILALAEKEGLDKEKVARALAGSRIRDLTEFGRAVHAEMEALLSCARARILTNGGTVYTTTFPCHNCAKHIVAAGIIRVVFIEPYQKSKAAELHKDSIRVGFTDAEDDLDAPPKVHFEPFVGVGPRRFFDLFSIQLGSGYPLNRKDQGGQAISWAPNRGRLRLQMLPHTYLDLELVASALFLKARGGTKE